MPLMTIPRHTPLTPAEMAARLRGILDAHPPKTLRVFREGLSTADPEAARLTQVPYLKLCLEGSFAVQTAGASERVGVGDAVLFSPRSFVGIVFSGETVFLRLTFEADGVLIGMERVRAQARKGRDVPAGLLEATWRAGGLRQPAAGLLERLLAGNGGGAAHERAALDCLLFELWMWLAEGEEEGHRGAEDRDAGWMRFVQDQAHLPVNRESLARALGVSSGYLGRRIRARTGMCFQEYLLRVRMDQAEWLLRHSRLSVEELGLRCGFSSGNYFAQCFRRLHGVSPSRWRRGGGR